LTKQEALDSAATRKAMSDQPRWEDTRVIQHEEIAGMQVVAETIEGRVLDGSVVSWEHQQPRLPALVWRPLRDQRLG